MEMRLQKALANSGVSSRRQAENLIVEGRVKVNGIVVNTLGTKVSNSDIIHVDDVLVTKNEKKYFLLNKPAGYICVTDDKLGRKTIFDLIDESDFDNQLHSIGRLDFHAQGLIIVTNDGNLTKVLTNKDKKINAVYQLRVSGIVLKSEVREMRKGFKYQKEFIKPLSVSIVELDKQYKTTLLEIIVNQGHGPALKSMLSEYNHQVKKLTRLTYDFLTTEGIKRGSYRNLKIHEVKRLQNLL